MNFRKFLCIVLSVLLIPGVSFAKKKNVDEDNPYGFELVSESKKTTYEIEADENENIDMDEINRNDTYRAQADADAAAMRKLEREASELSKKTRPKITVENDNKNPKGLKTRQPANKAAEIYYKFRYNPKVVSFLDTLKYGWKKFKKWFVTLPGIRHYLASPYSKENYKKELGKVDYVENKAKSDQLRKDSASAKVLKKGSKEFFK